MSKIAELANAPEVSFIGYLTLDEVKQMVSDWYNEKYKELTGTAPVLGDAAPESCCNMPLPCWAGRHCSTYRTRATVSCWQRAMATIWTSWRRTWALRASLPTEQR